MYIYIPCSITTCYFVALKTTIIIFFTETPIIEESPLSIVIDEEESESVSFNCVVTGAPSLRVSWLKGEKILTFTSPNMYRISESWMNGRTHVKSTLTIDHPTYEDSGRYACVSTVFDDETDEERFRAQANATLTVLGEKY